MKDTILTILKQHSQNLSNSHYHGRSMGVSEDDFESVADTIIELLELKPDV